MITSHPSHRIVRTALAIFGCVVAFSVAQVSSVRAADDKSHAAHGGHALPLTANVEKTGGGENAPYVLHLKNDSKESVKATAKILLAVAFHAENKAKNVPEHTVEPGKTWTIDGLANGDKVIVTAKGYDPLEVTVK